MMEGSVLEFVKWFLGMMILSAIITFGVFMFRLNEVNSFQQEVNYQIERHGGLTPTAMKKLNEQAKLSYGGCLLKSNDDDKTCYDPADKGGPSSGFAVREFKITGTTKQYYTRGDTEKARYGDQVNYVITRSIGNIQDVSFLKPATIGSAGSRVRGNN